jgi:hypothetical protein
MRVFMTHQLISSKQSSSGSECSLSMSYDDEIMNNKTSEVNYFNFYFTATVNISTHIEGKRVSVIKTKDLKSLVSILEFVLESITSSKNIGYDKGNTKTSDIKDSQVHAFDVSGTKIVFKPCVIKKTGKIGICMSGVNADAAFSISEIEDIISKIKNVVISDLTSSSNLVLLTNLKKSIGEMNLNMNQQKEDIRKLRAEVRDLINQKSNLIRGEVK